MGRSIPTLIPSSRASSIAFWPIRAIEPKATIRYSASSQSISSKRTSFFFNYSVLCLEAEVVFLHLFRTQFQRSDDVGLTVFCLSGRSPWTLCYDFRIRTAAFAGGRTTFSIICPITPSARMMAGLRYLNASSKASPTKSAIS